jgi:hypothetical protein
VQELGHDQVGDRVVDLAREEDDPLLEQAGVQVEGPLAAGALLDDGGDEDLAHDASHWVQPVGCTMVACPGRMCNSGVA